MADAASALTPSMTEKDAAALLAGASRTHGGAATVVLVGSDERISNFRHPLPTAKAIERYVMLVLCFRYQGLISALTRSVYFGKAPNALNEIAQAVARVDAHVIAATSEGRTMGEMFEMLRQAYEREGAPEAIEQHHQGGTIAYLGRETLARPDSPVRIETGQAFAWNPSLRGAKSEDTMILTANGPEIITEMDGWPVSLIETDAGPIARPAIREQ
jgi:antitoxin VapB